MNPIKKVWGVLSARVCHDSRQFSSVSELEEAVVQAWHEFVISLLESFIDLMPRQHMSLLTMTQRTWFLYWFDIRLFAACEHVTVFVLAPRLRF